MSASETSSIVVCFLFDGTDKYLRMTLNAVNSFITTTPHIKVGLLFPKNYDESIVVNQLSDPARASVRRFETHFQNWNPTQHKLDIIKFSDEFSTIFWLDSDAVVYQDLTDLLYRFHTSSCKVAFMKDHVCYNPQFLNVWLDWRKISDPFIPQASFMGFKREIIGTFFNAWEDTWRKWIEPVPFMNFPNPVPSFPGSAFCTEQYALGMVLESDLVTRADVFELRRITFPLRGLAAPGGANSSASASFDFSFSSFSGSFWAEQELSQLEEKFRLSFSFPTSWGGSFSFPTSWSGSYSFTEQSSWGPLESFTAVPTSWTSSAETSWNTSYETSYNWETNYPEFSFSYSAWETPSSYSGSFSNLASFSFGESFSFSSSSSARGVWAPIDNIEGKIVHFYSAFYDQSQSWWQKNNSDVIPQINQYWDQRNQRPVVASSNSPPSQHSSRYSPPRQHPHNTNTNTNNNNNNNNNNRYKDEPGL